MTRRVLEQRERTTLYLDTAGETPLVYKVLRDRAPSAADLADFYNELTLTKGLDVEGIRAALRRERLDGMPAIVLSFVAGEPLGQWAVRRADDIQEGLRIATELAASLARLHGAGIIHSDLNPSNVIYDSMTGRVTLIDFGLATRFDSKASESSFVRGLGGSLLYIAPEQTGRIDRTVDHRADLYSLGATLYQLFTGKPPFDLVDPLELTHAHIARTPVPAHEASQHVPAPLSRVLMRLLEKNPEDRYQSAHGVRADLARCEADLRRTGEVHRFELGLDDVPSGLRVPEKLYGRDEPIATLVTAWERASRGSVELALLAGPPGVGKSSLARSVRAKAAAPDLLYVESKCHRGDGPYVALGRALDAALLALVAGPEDRLRSVRDRLLADVGPLAALLVPIVPSLAAVLGEHDEPPVLGDTEAENRFQFVFRAFVRALCRPDRLFVVFLDDLQWAGAETLSLIEALATDGASGHLVIQGAHRLEGGEALAAMVASAEGAGASTSSVSLEPLGSEPIFELLVETLSASAEEVEALGALVEQKTQGNPFAIRQFLEALHDEGVIHFDLERHRWDWDAASAAELHIPDSVVEMLGLRLGRLPDETVESLRRAACVGTRFSLEAVAALGDVTPKQASWTLVPAVAAGLVQPLRNAARVIGVDADDDAYVGAELCFAHDRLHDAALALVDVDERRDLHLRLGRWLRRTAGDEPSPERLFEIVRHLGDGATHITDPEERTDLVRLELDAGRLAMRSAAHAQALTWLKQARELLPDDAWTSQRELTLAVCTELAEAAYASDDRDALEAAASEVDAHADSPLERTRVVIARIKALIASDDLEGGLAVGLEALEALGVRFPKSPRVPNLILATLGVKWALLGRAIPSLAEQDEMTDPRVLAAVPIIERIAPAAFRVGGKLYPLLVLQIVRLTARYGAVPVSSFGYGGYALTLAGVLGDIEGGYAVGEMAKRLADRFGDDRHRGSAIVIFEMFIRHWKEPLASSLDPLVEGWRLSASTGRVFEAAWAQAYRLLWMEAAGVELDSVQRNLTSWRDALRGDASADRMVRMLGRFVGVLRGESSSPTTLDGPGYLENETIEHGDETERAFYHQYKLRLALLFEAPDEARLHADELEARLEALTSMPMDPIARFYIAIARLRAGDPRPAKATAAKLAKWAVHCPANYSQKQHYLRAELAIHAGRFDAARVELDHAVRCAREHGFLHDEALALTRAARFYEARGSSLAPMLWIDAARAWRQLGATAMVERLGQNALPRALPAPTASPSHRSPPSASPHADEHELGSVDQITIVRSAAAIGAELKMEHLLARLLEIVLQNAGADRALLFLASDAGLVLEAEADADGAIETQQHRPLAKTRDVCVPVVRQVERSREIWRVSDATADAELSTDPYVTRSGVRSVLCVPFLASGKVRAVAYLENRLTAGAFTAQNAQTLSLLASQVVFSLQNAGLYGELEEAFDAQVALARASDRFVPQGFIESIGHSSIVDVTLGDSVRREMSVMFTDIRGFTSLMEGLEADENIRLVNSFLRFAEPAILNNSGFVVEYLGDAILALFETSDQVVRAGIEMRKSLPALNARRASQGAAAIEFGIGANTDELTLGIIGGDERIKAGVLGDGVNLAARVESLTKHYGVGMLISSNCRDGLVDPAQFRLRPIDRVRVKGRAEAVDLLEVYDADAPALRDAKDQMAPTLEQAYAAYREGELEEAQKAFGACREALPDDRTIALMLERCERYRGARTEPWTGVEVLDFK